MKNVKLNFIDNSNDASNSQIVFFQKNVATTFEEIAVAWKVIQNCGQGCNHPFVYPLEMKVSAADSWGNFTPQLVAYPGQLFHVTLAPSGNELSYKGPSPSPSEVQVQNDLSNGAISANILKDGKLLATKNIVAPSQKAVFKFKPTLWVGAVAEVEEGKVMDSAIISACNTELSLLGITSADIVMTGGGPGPDAGPFVFSMGNVVMA